MGNPTAEIRAKLDELGIAWETTEERWNADSITYWKVGGIKWVAFESENDTLWLNCNSITDVTPEQAIAATVGAGTCRDLAETPPYRDKTEFKCSECGYEYSAVGGFGCEYGDEPYFNFCPNCGKKVVDE